MRRWLVLALGFALAGVVGYALLTAGGSRPGRSPSTAKPRAAAAESEPRDQIGRESREALRQILREADREEER